MKLDADLDALGGVLFSLLACSMRDDKPSLRRATVKAARAALMEIPDAYLNPKLRRAASGDLCGEIYEAALSLLVMPHPRCVIPRDASRPDAGQARTS